MTQEEKQLLLKDLCARLPYAVIGYTGRREILANISIKGFYKNMSRDGWHPIEQFKPYLRPMSSMTEEESDEYNSFSIGEDWISNPFCCVPAFHVLDWLNAHHFDYRGLIEKGLALEAPEGMYKNV